MLAAASAVAAEGRLLPSPHRVTPSSSAVAVRGENNGRMSRILRCAARDDAAAQRGDAAAAAKGLTRTPHASLILIGGRGCGKSALCKRLVASDPRFTLRSLDDMIVEEAGMSIPRIVKERGWRWFRDAEFSMCERVACFARERRASGDSQNQKWTLIDAGGGVVVDLDDEGNEVFSERKIDALRGKVTNTGARENVLVYLRRDVGYLVNRTSGDKNRPTLSDTVSFAKLMERRNPWYFRAADYVVDATGGAVESEVKTKKEIKDEVLEYFYAETGAWPPEDERTNSSRTKKKQEDEGGEKDEGVVGA